MQRFPISGRCGEIVQGKNTTTIIGEATGLSLAGEFLNDFAILCCLGYVISLVLGNSQ